MVARITRTRMVGPALVSLLLMALLLTVAPAAHARSSSSYRESGRAAATDWIQWDNTPVGSGPFGNVHVGYLSAEETSKGLADVFGFIEDYDCEPGEFPGGGGHFEEFEEEEPEEGCDWLGFRFIEDYDISFTMDRKLESARLTGQLTVHGGGHGEGGVVGRPFADVIWTGFGDLDTTRYTSRWREGDTFGSDSYRAKGRSATMTGSIGPMGFDPDWSGGSMYSYSTSYRERTK